MNRHVQLIYDLRPNNFLSKESQDKKNIQREKRNEREKKKKKEKR